LFGFSDLALGKAGVSSCFTEVLTQSSPQADTESPSAISTSIPRRRISCAARTSKNYRRKAKKKNSFHSIKTHLQKRQKTGVPIVNDTPVDNNFQKLFKHNDRNVVSYIIDQNNGILTSLGSLLSIQVKVIDKDGIFLSGSDAAVAVSVLSNIASAIERNEGCTHQEILGILQEYQPPSQIEQIKPELSAISLKTRRKTICASSAGQESYIRSFLEKEMTFGIGPAGTGKTYLAIAAAVHHLENKIVDRIILTRPAGEAGEKLGYLPGDMKDKVDPFMQPLYDALNEFLGSKTVEKMIENGNIEISPIAFMRGRTLKNAFVVFDEAQNATTMQMKMFLTRMGEGAKMAIVGDVSQVDLPKGVQSGLIDAIPKLSNIDEIGIFQMTSKDIIRHPLVAKIIQAYDG
jgi:phosphate starvation-inducible PhoH-like protein